MFEINYSQLIQYEILDKLVTFMSQYTLNYNCDNNDINWLLLSNKETYDTYNVFLGRVIFDLI